MFYQLALSSTSLGDLVLARKALEQVSMEYHIITTMEPTVKGTTSLQGTLSISPTVYGAHAFSTSEKRTASLQEKKWLGPQCPLLGGSTHNTQQPLPNGSIIK